MPIDKTLYQNIKSRIANAVNETEVRDRFCAELYAFYNLDFRLERNRSDALLNSVILEFKDKGLFRGKATSYKFKEALKQLTKKYIPNQANAEGRAVEEYIGIAIDGEHYSFVFLEGTGSFRHTSLIKMNEYGFVPLIEILKQDTRRAFTSNNILEDFGSNQKLAKQILAELWNHLNKCLNDKTRFFRAKMLFQEWKKLFAQATNLGAVNRTKIDDYLVSIGLSQPLDYTKALFVLHTYNALLFKLIAAEVITSIRYKRYSGFAAEASACPNNELRDLIDIRIEHAELFLSNKIENFIEGSFFSWYIENPGSNLLEAIRSLLIRLGLYYFPTSAKKGVRDIVKAIYQDIVPEALRKNIGEFYTPEWLVEFVLDHVGYRRNQILELKILDPCCGSGNFLIQAISRIKHESNVKGYDKRQLFKTIINNIVGFDLNPIAVLSARLNYLLAILDIIPSTGRVEIPVYMADAVYAPVRGQSYGSTVRSYRIGTVLGDIEFELPEKLVQRRNDFGKILSLMEQDVEINESKEGFLRHLREDGRLKKAFNSNPSWSDLIKNMYQTILSMEKKKWNKIWCRIVRNYFSSIAIGKVDIIAGNPPWVRWSELPKDYRERIKPTCKNYKIFSDTPYFGGNELDISGMIAYTVSDKWLKLGGVLGFVITQSHFQAASSKGFRYFELPNGTPLRVKEVHDFSSVKPFSKLANKPAVFTWRSGRRTTYPVKYREWEKKGRTAIPENANYNKVRTLIKAIDKEARPLPSDGRWSILFPKDKILYKKLKGRSKHFIGRKGITTDLNGVYFVDVVGPGASANLLKIRTKPDSGKKKIPLIDRDVEQKLVYPLLKSASQIRPFKFSPIQTVAIIPNFTITSIPSENDFKSQYRATFQYFYRVNQVVSPYGKPILEDRSTWKSRLAQNNAPFYSVYNIGPYTFAPYKVAWAEIAGSMHAAVISNQRIPISKISKVIIPDHKIYFVPFDNQDEAHFLCSLLNSTPIRTFVNSYTVKLQVGTLFKHIKLPRYDSAERRHMILRDLSIKAHLTGVDDAIQRLIDKEAWNMIKKI